MICSVYFNISHATQHYKTRNRPLFYLDLINFQMFAVNSMHNIVYSSLKYAKQPPDNRWLFYA